MPAEFDHLLNTDPDRSRPTPLSEILSAPGGARVHTTDGPLRVSGRVFLNREAVGAADRVVLTQDGRGAIYDRWHRTEDGPEDHDAVYFEVYDSRGRQYHGWVDRRSRKVVQSG